jgi:polyisoprenoid-binding protein YceI
MDTDLSPKDHAEVQGTMLGAKVLDSENFPQIRFHSTGVEKLLSGKWKIRGDLTLHGQTHPVEVEVSPIRTTTEARPPCVKKISVSLLSLPVAVPLR